MDYKTTYATSTDPRKDAQYIIEYHPNIKFAFPHQCDYCSNNPKNGGSGICFCTVGIIPITC